MDHSVDDELLNAFGRKLCLLPQWRHVATIFGLSLSDIELIEGLKPRLDSFVKLMHNSIQRNGYDNYDLWEKLHEAIKADIRIDVDALKVISSEELDGKFVKQRQC